MSILELFKSKSLARAAVESILIMFGVLAALAVQSWWDNEVGARNPFEPPHCRSGRAS
jgi:hypothetical protein